MTTTQTAQTSTTFDVVSPGTGEVVGSYPMHTEADVRAAVRRAREAAAWWSGLSYGERRKRLDAFRGVLARRMHQLAGIMSDETGKPASDAALEVALVLDHVAWAGKNAESVLRRRRVKSGLLTAHLAGTVEYRPLGVSVEGHGDVPRHGGPDAAGPGWWVDDEGFTLVRLPAQPVAAVTVRTTT